MIKKKNHGFRYLINTVAILIIFAMFSLYTTFGSNYWSKQFIVVCIYIILAASLNLTSGFLGQLPLGHAGFMAVGAYASAIVSKTVVFASPNLGFGIALLTGGVFAALFGVLVGLPALRLRGDYLAIITLGFGEIIKNILNNLSITGGAKGLTSIPRSTTFTWAFACVVITLFVIHTLIQSSHGRAIKAIRENEIAASSCGINVTYYKTMAFTVAAFFAGIGGGLYAHYLGSLYPVQMGFNKSIEILVMVVLGGMGSLAGSVISATALTILPELLRGFDQYRMIIYSLVLVIVMIFKPSGLLGRYSFSLLDFIKDFPKNISKLYASFVAFFKRRFGKGGAKS